MIPTAQILQGDSAQVLKTLADGSIQCCVTSPPYFALRSYGGGHKEIGQEKSPELYIHKLVEVFREVRRILKDDGTLWVVIGDSYAASGKGGNPKDSEHQKQPTNDEFVKSKRIERGSARWGGGNAVAPGCKRKDLIGVPWMLAFALRSDGWYLRMDNIWNKPNPMPESVTDRTTKAHEYVFHLSKSESYYYDHEAIKDPPSPDLIKQIEDGYNGKAVKDYIGATVQDASATKGRIINGYRTRIDKQRGHSRRHAGLNDKWDALSPAEQALCGRNKRSVWTVPPANFKEAHFATFPPDLIKPCILAGSRTGDTVLDPFAGTFTTGMVAMELGRSAIGIELNEAYCQLARDRTNITPGMKLV